MCFKVLRPQQLKASSLNCQFSLTLPIDDVFKIPLTSSARQLQTQYPPTSPLGCYSPPLHPSNSSYPIYSATQKHTSPPQPPISLLSPAILQSLKQSPYTSLYLPITPYTSLYLTSLPTIPRPLIQRPFLKPRIFDSLIPTQHITPSHIPHPL